VLIHEGDAPSRDIADIEVDPVPVTGVVTCAQPEPQCADKFFHCDESERRVGVFLAPLAQSAERLHGKDSTLCSWGSTRCKALSEHLFGWKNQS
jgi:hypothetical protein